MPKIKTINRFDVVGVNAERGLTLSEKVALSALSCGTTSSLQNVPFHPQWKHRIEAQQPGQAWVKEFLRIIGADMTVELAYVEVARDFLVPTRIEAERMHGYFLATVLRPYERKLAIDEQGTSYFGERLSPTGTLSIYSDRPFKLESSALSPCLHVEMRLGNLPLLLKKGLVTVQDLIDFDYEAFWAKNLHCVDLPSKTALGRLLGSPGAVAVQDQTYRKRANELFHTPAFNFSRGFVLHNAALCYPRIRRLPSITFDDWEELARSAALLLIKVGR